MFSRLLGYLVLSVGLVGAGSGGLSVAKAAGEAGGSATAARLAMEPALKAANELIGDAVWKLVYVSNTGVAGGSVSGFGQKPGDALMLADGTAGRWVFEYFRDEPEPVSQGGRTGWQYPYRRVGVSGDGQASELPEATMGGPSKMVALSDACRLGLDEARKLAISGAKADFELMAVAAFVPSDRPCAWAFRFYDLDKGEIVVKRLIAGDGSRVLPEDY